MCTLKCRPKTHCLAPIAAPKRHRHRRHRLLLRHRKRPHRLFLQRRTLRMPRRERSGGEAAADRQVTEAWRAPDADEANRRRRAERLRAAPGGAVSVLAGEKERAAEQLLASGMSGSSRTANCRPDAPAVVVFIRPSSAIWRWPACRGSKMAVQALSAQRLHGRFLVECCLQELTGHVRRVAAAQSLAAQSGPASWRLRDCGSRARP